METKQTRTILIAVVAFIIGWAVGLFAFGWGLTPVQYEAAGTVILSEEDQDARLIALADLLALDPTSTKAQEELAIWTEADQRICLLARTSADSAQAARLEGLARSINNNVGCPDSAEEGDGGGLNFFVLVCGLLLVLALIVVAIFVVWQRRNQTPTEDITGDVPTISPLMDQEEVDQMVIPIARFQTNYTIGHDTYDDSFSIENADGDFLGECGVGISETIGSDGPKHVTAFEVWLFDKNDIRTVTKVIMSDHAFFDEAIKAKLAPKGEPVLARPNETIVLETASLIINAEISDMEYGTDSSALQSYFDRFTVELSAWAKEGDFGEADVQGRIDEMLEF